MISFTHTLILTRTHTYTDTPTPEEGSRKEKGEWHWNNKKLKKWWHQQKVCVCVTNRRQRERRNGTQSTGAMEGWVTSYLFGMMKIFPSRQPFVALVPGTACQICFSSPSSRHTAAVTHTSTHTVCLPTDHNRCASVWLRLCVFFFPPLKDTGKAARIWGAITSITSGLNYLSLVHTHTHKHMLTQRKSTILTFSMSLSHKVLSSLSSHVPSSKALHEQ